MANRVRKGLHPVKMADGSDYVPGGRPYYVPSSDGTALYIGDPVIVTGTANASPVLGFTQTGGAIGYAAGQLPTVTRATNGDDNRITGVVVRVGYEPVNNSKPNYRVASTEAVVWVEDRSNVLYEIPASGSLAVTDIGLNANITGSGGDTTTGLSNCTLNSTTPSADASNQLLIVRGSLNPEKCDFGSASPSVYVKLNRLTQDPDQVLGI